MHDYLHFHMNRLKKTWKFTNSRIYLGAHSYHLKIQLKRAGFTAKRRTSSQADTLALCNTSYVELFLLFIKFLQRFVITISTTDCCIFLPFWHDQVKTLETNCLLAFDASWNSRSSLDILPPSSGGHKSLMVSILYWPKETSMFGWIWQNCFAGTTGAGPNSSSVWTAASIVQFLGNWSIAFVCFLLHNGQ